MKLVIVDMVLGTILVACNKQAVLRSVPAVQASCPMGTTTTGLLTEVAVMATPATEVTVTAIPAFMAVLPWVLDIEEMSVAELSAMV